MQSVDAEGAVIGGGVKTGGGSLTGRDAQAVTVNNYEERQAGQLSFEKQLNTLSDQVAAMTRQFTEVNTSVTRLIILIDGDQKYGSTGLREEMKEVIDNEKSQLALEQRVQALSTRVIVALVACGILTAELVFRIWIN
ncbi:MAG: hypothetical protein IPL32_18410 [Chloracidobacterium sp.]|nr:hypothetical protein [Chloracidobacterium sp.]